MTISIAISFFVRNVFDSGTAHAFRMSSYSVSYTHLDVYKRQIREIPAVDLNRIQSMDPAADKAKALENNYTLRINKKKLANSSNNSKKESLQMTIDDNIQRIGSSVDSAYKNVIQSQTAYQQAAVSLEVASKNMEAAERKMQIGTLSRLDYFCLLYTS